MTLQKMMKPKFIKNAFKVKILLMTFPYKMHSVPIVPFLYMYKERGSLNRINTSVIVYDV